MHGATRYYDYFKGRADARTAVIKQIYVKHYRRKFAAGNFRASWIPKPEKLKMLFESANAKDMTDRCILLTINPTLADYRHGQLPVLRFLLALLERIREYQNFIDLDAEFCLEHRGSEFSFRGLHMHIAFSNQHGLSRSDILRRVQSAAVIVARDHPLIIVSEQSVDVKVRPRSSAFPYIKKSRDYDVIFGLGYQGMIHQDLNQLSATVEEAITTRLAALRALDDAGQLVAVDSGEPNEILHAAPEPLERLKTIDLNNENAFETEVLVLESDEE